MKKILIMLLVLFALVGCSQERKVIETENQEEASTLLVYDEKTKEAYDERFKELFVQILQQVEKYGGMNKDVFDDYASRLKEEGFELKIITEVDGKTLKFVPKQGEKCKTLDECSEHIGKDSNSEINVRMSIDDVNSEYVLTLEESVKSQIN